MLVLPDELLQCIFSSIHSDIDEGDLDQALEDQASHSALSGTCKRLHRIGKKSLFEDRPLLDTRQRVESYLASCLEQASLPTRRTQGEQQVLEIREMHLVQPYDIPDSGAQAAIDRVVLPDLRPLSDLGCFARLTSLSIVNWVDGNFLVPALFAPFSPLRSTIKYWEFLYYDNSYIDSFALTFILDATIHLPEHLFVLRPVLPLSARFVGCTLDDDWDAGDVTEGTPDPSVLLKARADFEIFASQWSEHHADDVSQYRQVRDLVQPSLADQSPFDRLSTLVITVHTEIHIALLLDTGNLRHLKELDLWGPQLKISVNHVTSLRRAISRSDQDLVVHGHEGAFKGCTSSNPSHPFAGASLWIPLSRKAVEEFGNYAGPRLEVLKLSLCSKAVY
ncbi:hypothetical protein JCM16303_004970 [Sporobolomyces ruberrimus]